MTESGRVEILAIGDELLDGRVVDTNTVRLAVALNEVGLHLSHRATVVDDMADIVAAAKAAAARGTALCVVSGGLGPTADDLTAAAFAELLGVPLQRDAAQAEIIAQRLAGRGRPLTDNQLRQADRPRGARLVANPVGTAPGFAATYGGCRFVACPGVPREFDAMVEAEVVAPRRAGAAAVCRAFFFTFGLIEAEVDARLEGFAAAFPQVRLQFRVKLPEVHVSLHAGQADAQKLTAAVDWVEARLQPFVFSRDPEVGFAASLLAQLRAAGSSLALAESCTGGLVGDLLTDVPGSSEVLELGVVAYSYAAKQAVLAVPEAALAREGAVSQATVEAMAEGARRLAGATYGLATSGIAGPGGGTETKPVGTLWIAACNGTRAASRCLHLPIGRQAYKRVAAYSVLDLLRRQFLA